jgi:hypothetical protein
MNFFRFATLTIAACFLLAESAANAARPAATSAASPNAAVDLFAAKNAGQVSVRLIPHDSKSGQVVITNNTASPLTIKLPEAFAGVPVLAQRAGGGFGGPFGANAGGPGGGNQSVAGVFNGSGVNRGVPGGGGPGFFNIGPERAVKVKFVSVCLDHGKPEPSSRVPYEIVPIDSHTNDSPVIELAQMLGRGELDQPAAQAAAWHLANGLTWQELASQIGVKHIDGRTEPLFSFQTLQNGRQAAQDAARRARRQQISDSSPGIAAQGSRP